jgi:hypothetical protein
MPLDKRYANELRKVKLHGGAELALFFCLRQSKSRISVHTIEQERLFEFFESLFETLFQMIPAEVGS